MEQRENVKCKIKRHDQNRFRQIVIFLKHDNDNNKYLFKLTRKTVYIHCFSTFYSFSIHHIKPGEGASPTGGNQPGQSLQSSLGMRVQGMRLDFTVFFRQC